MTLNEKKQMRLRIAKLLGKQGDFLAAESLATEAVLLSPGYYSINNKKD